MILKTFLHYIREISFPLACGLLLSGIFHEFVCEAWVKERLAQKGIRPLLYATISGILLPLCCFGALPIIIGLKKRGVGLGPILAFLVATPATSIPAILVATRLLGVGFTLYLCLSVVIIALILGIIGNHLHVPYEEERVCPHCEKVDSQGKKRNWERVVSAVRFGFIDVGKRIGLLLIVGLIMASLVKGFTPIGNLVKGNLASGFGYVFALVFGLLMYICATGSVPLVHALVEQGMNIGAGLLLLIVGPITSYATVLVIGREFGAKVLIFYLGVISFVALSLGYIYSLI